MKIILRMLCQIGVPLVAFLAVNGNVHCRNIIVFIALVTLILSPIVFLSLMKPGKPEPFWEGCSHLSDAATVVILVYYGWLWCAACFAWGRLACGILFGARKYHAEKAATAAASKS